MPVVMVLPPAGGRLPSAAAGSSRGSRLVAAGCWRAPAADRMRPQHMIHGRTSTKRPQRIHYIHSDRLPAALASYSWTPILFAISLVLAAMLTCSGWLQAPWPHRGCACSRKRRRSSPAGGQGAGAIRCVGCKGLLHGRERRAHAKTNRHRAALRNRDRRRRCRCVGAATVCWLQRQRRLPWLWCHEACNMWDLHVSTIYCTVFCWKVLRSRGKGSRIPKCYLWKFR